MKEQVLDELEGSFEGTGIRRVRVAVLKEQVLDELGWQF